MTVNNTEFYDDKITTWVFLTKQKSDLKSTDLLVYSALAYQNQNNKNTTDTRLAWRTGVSRQTVAASIKRLEEKKLVVDRQAQPCDDIFLRRKGSKDAGADILSRYAFWKCLIPDTDDVSIQGSMVFSLLLHFAITKHKTNWSVAYIAKILGMHVATVKKAIEQLEDLQLMRHEKWQIASCLVGRQNNFFKKKEVMEKSEIGTFTPSLEAVNEAAFAHIPDASDQQVAKPQIAEAPKVKRDFCPRRFKNSQAEILTVARMYKLTEDQINDLKEKYIGDDGCLTIAWSGFTAELASKETEKVLRQSKNCVTQEQHQTHQQKETENESNVGEKRLLAEVLECLS